MKQIIRITMTVDLDNMLDAGLALRMANDAMHRIFADKRLGDKTANTSIARVMVEEEVDILDRERTYDTWDGKPPEEKKRELSTAATTVFIDDVESFFVSVDCGGDLDLLTFDSTTDREAFTSLHPDEIRRLHKVLGDRIAEWNTVINQ